MPDLPEPRPWHTIEVLRVEPIEPAAWIRMLVVASTIIVAIELHKIVRRRRSSDRAQTGAGRVPARDKTGTSQDGAS